MSVFFLILATLLLLNFLWWWRADFGLRKSGSRWRVRIWPLLWAAAMGGLLIFVIASRDASAPTREFLPVPIIAAVYLWHLIVLPVWLLATPFIGLAGLIGRKKKGRTDRTRAKNSGWTRRRFIASLVAFLPPVILTGLTAISLPQLHNFRIRRFTLPIPNLPPSLDGLTIAHVADVHVGSFTHGKTLHAIADATNALDVDLVFLPGDLINNDIKDLPEAIAMVKSLEARHGVFLCEGNHDLIPGRDLFGEQVKAAGLQLLINEEKTIRINGGRVQILGLRWGGPASPIEQPADYSDDAISGSMRELLQLRNPRAFPILLAHHPHAFDPAAEADVPLVISGHTHGGQLMINEKLGFGPAMYRYWSGIYRKKNSTLAVSNGVGNWFPLRTSAPAEILHLTLRIAEKT